MKLFFEEFCKIRLHGVMTFDQKVLTLLINTLVRDISPMKVILFAVNFQKVASRQLHKSLKVARGSILDKLKSLNFFAFHLHIELGI